MSALTKEAINHVNCVLCCCFNRCCKETSKGKLIVNNHVNFL